MAEISCPATTAQADHEAARNAARTKKWKQLRLSLKYRPKLFQKLLKMRQNIRRKSAEIKTLQLLKANLVYELHNIHTPKEFKHSSTQTIEISETNSTKTKKCRDISKDEVKGTAASETEKGSQQDTEQSTNAWESGDNAKSIADQVKEAALNALTEFENNAGWNVKDHGDNEKSIADQVKEAAQSAMQQSGMVYVESARMYYDYKTGYYYNSELGLYYHTDTNCYYYYSDEKQQFMFHSYPDTSAVNANLVAHQKKKARKELKRKQQEQNKEDDIENLTKTLSQDKEDKKTKRRKTKKLENTKNTESNVEENKDENKNNDVNEKTELEKDKPELEEDIKESTDMFENKEGNQNEAGKEDDKNEEESKKNEENGTKKEVELEDGECSDSASDGDNDDNDDNAVDEDDSSSNASTATVEDEDSIAKHLPPCMRVIVRETELPKLKVGSLYLITKDGGTIGREGDQHAILLKDQNVSRNHLDVRYDMQKRSYVATDLGSKNGTILNGNRMSESSEVSLPMDILHGSTIQLGETKLLCHIHPGNDTCGHCEPGLIMESEEKEKKAAYTRTCSVKKQHELELARLKNIYAPKLLEIEEKPYIDRAQARRETVGSSHHSVKTESASLETSIPTENKGFKLLQKMGWSEGEGLGKESQGDIEPVPLVSNEGKSGLGTTGAVSAPPLVPKPRPKNTLAAATMRLAARTKMLQPPAKAFQAEDEEDHLDE